MKFLSHIHSFRGFAITGIMGAHSLQSLNWDHNSILFKGLDTLFNQSSIWFFFIAGLMFQYLSERYQYQKYLNKKLVNVVLPYLLLSIPAIVLFVFFQKQDNVPGYFYDYPIIEQVLIFLYTGKHLAPFWFVPTICFFYLLAPLFIWIDRNPKMYLCLPFFIILSAILGRGGLQEWTGMVLLFAPISKAVYLLSVYLFGCFCGHYHEEFLQLTRKYEALLIALVLGCFSLNILYYNQQVYYLYFFKLLCCPLLTLQFYRFDKHVKDKLFTLGDLSFGIFFIHGYFLGVLNLASSKFSFADILHGNLFTQILIIIALGVLCIYSLKACKYIFGKKSRMLVGC